MTPSSAPPPARASQRLASGRRRLAGDKRNDTGASRPANSASSAARRSDKGRSARSPSGERKRSKAIRSAGVSAASLAMRLAAGCRRICRASKDNDLPTGMTSSPSSTTRSTGKAAIAAATSGKKRARLLPDRPSRSTLRPSRLARQRKPSHLGSNCQPLSRGSSSTCRASIATVCISAQRRSHRRRCALSRTGRRRP